MSFMQQPTVSWIISSTTMYPSWIKTREDLLRAHWTAVSWTGEPLNHLTCPHATKCQPKVFNFFFFPPLSELISRYNCTSAQLIFYFILKLIHAVYIKVKNGSFCLDQSEDMYDLTIRVSVAECAVFVLIFDFHLHCLVPALECKQAPLPGSAKRLGAITLSAWLHIDMQRHLYSNILSWAASNDWGCND